MNHNFVLIMNLNHRWGYCWLWASETSRGQFDDRDIIQRRTMTLETKRWGQEKSESAEEQQVLRVDEHSEGRKVCFYYPELQN